MFVGVDGCRIMLIDIPIGSRDNGFEKYQCDKKYRHGYGIYLTVNLIWLSGASRNEIYQEIERLIKKCHELKGKIIEVYCNIA